MLEKLPSGIGRALKRARAGAEDLAVADTELTGVNASIEVSSPAFEYNTQIPSKYTADGDGSSPPIEWRGVPMNAEAIVLLIEDADSPTPQPLVHAIVWDLPGSDASLPEGALPSARKSRDIGSATDTSASKDARSASDAPSSSDAMGRNSYLSATYLPPDPPSGHGTHRYVFQVFALDSAPRFESPPGRSALLDKIRGHVIAKGLLIGTYGRA